MNINNSNFGTRLNSINVILGVSLLILGFSICPANAIDLPREAVIPLALATKAATAAVEKCKKDGYQVSVAVVDRAGVLKALLRADGAGPHTWGQ